MKNTNPKKILSARSKMIEYTKDQEKALVHIQMFLESKDLFYILVGNAGTGKTTIAENIANHGRASMLAPTNAAVKRLKDKFMSDDIPEDRFMTIHQTLYGAPDPETGEFIPKEGLKNSRVYIVDEASMIDDKVLTDLLATAVKGKKKLIFLGDDFQLEPVGFDPKIFNWENSKEVFKEHWKFKLNEVKRNDGTILAVATHLRNNKGCEILHYDNQDFQIVDRFTSNLPLDIAHDKDFIVLVSTNKRRMEYNQHIRKAKFEEESKEAIVSGERLIAVSNQQFLNGELYTVKHPKILKAFVGDINIGSIMYPEDKQYRFYLVEHEIEGSDKSYLTLFVPQLDKPSMHPSQLMNLPQVFTDETLMPYSQTARKKMWNIKVNIATYGYATSVHKSQGNEWDTVYIDCDWLSPKWNHARWLYTAITRAKKRVELKNSNYFQLKTVKS